MSLYLVTGSSNYPEARQLDDLHALRAILSDARTRAARAVPDGPYLDELLLLVNAVIDMVSRTTEKHATNTGDLFIEASGSRVRLQSPLDAVELIAKQARRCVEMATHQVRMTRICATTVGGSRRGLLSAAFGRRPKTNRPDCAPCGRGRARPPAVPRGLQPPEPRRYVHIPVD